MTQIPPDARQLLDKQHFVIVSSFDRGGSIHASAKGVIEVGPKGKIFILDLHKTKTYRNIKRNPHVTLTAIDERAFKGYSVKGRARIVKENFLPKKSLKIWHDKLSKRIARRVIRHVKEGLSGHEGIPEARFPFPKYIIEVSADSVIDLAPKSPDSITKKGEA